MPHDKLCLNSSWETSLPAVHVRIKRLEDPVFKRCTVGQENKDKEIDYLPPNQSAGNFSWNERKGLSTVRETYCLSQRPRQTKDFRTKLCLWHSNASRIYSPNINPVVVVVVLTEQHEDSIDNNNELFDKISVSLNQQFPFFGLERTLWYTVTLTLMSCTQRCSQGSLEDMNF